MEFPKLYHKGKLGKIVEWKVWTEGDVIHTEYGEEDGKKQHTSKVAEPKNVGRKNATTGEQQARLEAAAMHKHRLDRKYSATREEAYETVFLPMLAQDFKAKKTKVEYPVHVQPKFDGNRCMAYWDQGEAGPEVRLLSRGGKFYTIPHIQEALTGVLPRDQVLDGELYIHGESLQAINRLVKKWRDGPDGSIRLEYHVYDGFQFDEEETPWAIRHDALQGLIGSLTQIILPVTTVIAKSEQEVLQAEENFVSRGYEGAIVRTAEGLYELGHRSCHLLKVKSFLDDEFEIVGHGYGTGKAAKCVVWKCKTKEGKTFDCVPKGTYKMREYWGANAEKYYGKKLTVKYQKLTEDGIPFLPVGKGFRLDADLPKG